MDIATYCAKHGTQTELAHKLELPSQLISQWARGVRPVPIERCVPIEIATDGAVRRWDTRPDDWHVIWPELREKPEAPKVSA
jgi:DNA-binding transcriptional regulator YdaS (Cro superfamily)